MISHAHFFRGKLILAAGGTTVDSLFFRQVEMASSKLISGRVSPTDRLPKNLISTPDCIMSSLVD